ncbi:MAG: proline dehydrogenase [Vicingaceae bacterium]|jgi:proline dehydrogenase
MLSFENTKIAFASRSDRELKKAHFVFKVLAISWLNSIGTKLTMLALNLGLPVKGLIKWTVFDHFCGGEDILDCENTIQGLASYNVKTILDYSVEGKQNEADFDHCLGKAVSSIERAKLDGNVPFCVIKLTGLIEFDLLEKISGGTVLSEEENIAFLKGRNRVDIIAQNAFNAHIPLMIDAEESWIQNAIDEIAHLLMTRYNLERAIVYNTAQMYRHDRFFYIKNLHQKAEEGNFYIGLKIVRGAYMEKERNRATKMSYLSPIQPSKSATDVDYDRAIQFCVENIGRISICAGTHNEKSSLLLTEIMKDHQILEDDSRIYFSQLLGMSDHISFNLSKVNFNVAKYVPYGPVREVMPYLIRRADENTSVAGQTGRELNLIRKELDRRSL